MQLTEIQNLFEYNYWANRRLLETSRQLTQQQFEAPGTFPFGGLRGTLVHVLDTEYSWRSLLADGAFSDELVEADFPTLEAVEIRSLDEETAMRRYLSGLRDDSLTAVVRYTTEKGQMRERILWHCLFHVVNHGTQHRSEAAAILTGFGTSPGDLDFTVFLNSPRKRLLGSARGPAHHWSVSLGAIPKRRA